MNCPNCHHPDLDDSDIFCSNCGTDLQSALKAQKYSTSKINLVSKIQAAPSDALVLTSETIKDYQTLTQEINDLQDIPQKLSLSSQQLQFMESRLAKNENQVNELKFQLQKEKHDVEKLKKLSVTSVIARVKGDKEEKLKKEEEEYFSLLNKIEGQEKDIAAQKNEINSLSKHITDLRNLNERLQQMPTSK